MYNLIDVIMLELALTNTSIITGHLHPNKFLIILKKNVYSYLKLCYVMFFDSKAHLKESVQKIISKDVSFKTFVTKCRVAVTIIIINKMPRALLVCNSY